jgi:hypothetical protein
MAGKASASAEVLEIPGSMDEAMETGFLPEDESYRLTGKFKAEKKEDSVAPGKKENEQEQEEKDPAETTDASPASSSETAADSEPAKPQTEESKRQEQQREPRWKKRERELKEAKAEIARLKAQGTQPQQARSETPQEKTQPQPAADASKAALKPRIDDKDEKTGQPKYKTYAEYEDAKDDWLRKETLREFSESQSKSQRETQQQQVKQTIAREWTNRVETARAKHADFNTVALNPDLPLKEGSVPDVFILDSPAGTDVLYYLGQNPAELERINKLNPIGQARELTKIELKVSGQQNSSSAKPESQAPRPPHQVSGKGTVAKDAIEEAVESQNADTYMEEANRRDPRVQAVLRSRKGK